jgi:FMN-dependent NADH-azoreductase
MNGTVIRNILRVDSSARGAASVSRQLGDEVEARLLARHPDAGVTRLDLAAGVPHIDADWVAASFTPADARDAAQAGRLAASDAAIAALDAADAVVMTAPVYNFAIPSVLKAWIDHLCRAGVTFRYTADGPVALLADRPVYLVMASGGVSLGSPADFASGYLRHVLGFICLHDVRLVGAEGVARDPEAARARALGQIEHWLPAPAGQAA